MGESPHKRGEEKKAKQNSDQAIYKKTLPFVPWTSQETLENDWRALTTSYFELKISKHYKTIIGVWISDTKKKYYTWLTTNYSFEYKESHSQQNP